MKKKPEEGSADTLVRFTAALCRDRMKKTPEERSADTPVRFITALCRDSVENNTRRK
jgi:hypothetical protein